MLELYFPEDKAEYLPSILFLILTILLAYFAVQAFKKISKKQKAEAEEIEKKIMEDQYSNTEKDSRNDYSQK